MDTVKDFTRTLFKPIKKFLFSGIPFIYGWFALIRDEFFPLEWKEKLNLLEIFNILAWYWWVIIGLVTLLIWTEWDAAKFRKDKSNLPSTKIDISLKPTPRENGQYESIRVYNKNQDEPVDCIAFVKKMEWFKQDPKNINGGGWISINTEEKGPLSWHHGSNKDGYKKIHAQPEFINIAKYDFNQALHRNIVFTFLAEKPFKAGRYKIWVDVVCRVGENFKTESWIGCIDMVEPMRTDKLEIMECEDIKEWKQEQAKKTPPKESVFTKVKTRGSISL